MVSLALTILMHHDFFLASSVVDPGFPVGGFPTPNVATFQKFCMSKRKNYDL